LREENRRQFASISAAASGLNAETSLPKVIQVVAEFVMPIVDKILKEDRPKELWKQGRPWKSS